MKIRKIDSFPILHVYNDMAFTLIRIDNKDSYEYAFEIRDSKSFKILFKDSIQSSTYLTVIYDIQHVILSGYGIDKYLIDLESLSYKKISCEISIFHKYKEHFISYDSEKKHYVLLNDNLEELKRIEHSNFDWIKTVLSLETKISEYDYLLKIYDPLSFEMLWNRKYKGSISIKDSIENLFILQIREKEKDVLQIIETKTDIIKFEKNHSFANAIIDDSENLVFIGNHEGIISISLIDFKEVMSYKYPRTAVFTAFIGISDEGLMYNGRSSENFFGLIDCKSGKGLWEYDYIPDGANSLNIRKWVSLKNGKHIISCLGSGVFEFEP